MSVSKAWYISCDECGDPAEISTESAKEARNISKYQNYQRKKVAGKMIDLCPSCNPDPNIK